MIPVTRTRILGNVHNRVRGAAITASAQRASTQVHLLAQARTGNGAMAVGGAYTGGADTVVDVEVLGGAAGALRASTPVLSGVGNGTVEVLSIDPAADPQTLTFTLLEAGDDSTPALLDFFGVQLAARVPGSAGNTITLSVTRSLTYTDLPFATLESIAAGTAQFQGPQYDWGQPPATSADVPLGALRIAFAGIPQVLRAWKTWDKGQFTYRLDPAPAYEVPENTRVRAVSGGYTITVQQGATTETYTATTIFEFLSQVRARSALLQVLGVVAEDRAPGGQAVTDIPLRTDAHALPAIASVRRGTTIAVGAVAPTAPTENITITCMGRTTAGAQSWSVSGGVSGQLPAASTGVPYASGPVAFTIPAPPAAVAEGASIYAFPTWASRADDEGLPAICFKPLTLGAAAVDKEVTFVYTKRPPADCSCANLPALRLSLACLGLQSGDDLAMDARIQERLVDLMRWRADFIAANIALHDGRAVDGESNNGAASPGAAVVFADKGDVDLCNSCIPALVEALQEIYEVPAALDEWDAVFGNMATEFEAFAALVRNATGDTNPIVGGGGYGSGNTVLEWEAAIPFFVNKYTSAMEVCRALAGLLPKSDASGTEQGSPCWRDPGDAYWWADANGYYLPMFTNQPYHSVMRDADGKIVSTQEFGLGLVTQCEHRLKEGDRITVRISNTRNQSAWAEGDRFVIPLIAAGSAPLTGGADGDPTQTWTVRSSTLGALPDWHYNPAAPSSWTDGPAEVALRPGGIPFEVGDNIAFSIEGGRLRWRRDGGAWTEADLYEGDVPLGDGLLLQPATGAAPSFVGGDTWQFRAIATHGTDRLRQPRPGRAFAWDGAAVTLALDLGSAQPIELVMLALHDLPTGAAVELEGGTAAHGEWSMAVDVRPGVMLAALDPAHAASVRYLRLLITGTGAGGSIGWLWAGQGWQPTVTPAITRARAWALTRGTGINAGALYRGAGMAGTWAWSLAGDECALFDDSLVSLLGLLDHAAAQGAEALALVPDLAAPADAALCTVNAEEIEMQDFGAWQSTAQRAVSLSLPLRAVIV